MTSLPYKHCLFRHHGNWQPTPTSVRRAISLWAASGVFWQQERTQYMGMGQIQPPGYGPQVLVYVSI